MGVLLDSIKASFRCSPIAQLVHLALHFVGEGLSAAGTIVVWLCRIL